MVKRKFLFIFLFFLLITGNRPLLAWPQDYGPRFQAQIQKAISGLEQTGTRRRLRLKAMNDSIEKMRRVARDMVNWLLRSRAEVAVPAHRQCGPVTSNRAEPLTLLRHRHWERFPPYRRQSRYTPVHGDVGA